MEFKLTHADIAHPDVNKETSFDSLVERFEYLSDIIRQAGRVVFLLLVEDSEDKDFKSIFVFDDLDQSGICQYSFDHQDFEYLLLEFKSYEEAYKVALTMKSENPLCYKKS